MKNPDAVLFEANGDVYGAAASIRQCGVTSLSLKALQAYLSSKGHNAVVLTQNNETLNEFASKINSYNPLIAGATTTTSEFPITAELMREIKARNPKIITILGGYHVSAYPHSLHREQCPENINPSGIDMAVVGEGEETLTEIVESAKNNSLKRKLNEIKGIAYLDNGKLRINQPRDLIREADSLPFPSWTSEELEANEFNGPIYREKGNVVAIITERGCPYGCRFCATQTVYGRKARTRSVENIVDEIESLVEKSNVKMIADYAPTPNRSLERLHEFCRELRDRGLQKKFSMYVMWRLETPKGKPMFSEEVIKDLAETLTCFKTGIGVEALTPEEQEFIGKKHSVENLYKLSEMCEKNGVFLRGFFMVNPKTTQEAIDSCKNNKLVSVFDDLRVTYITPFPGTPLYNLTKGNLLTSHWGDFSVEVPVLPSEHLTQEQLNSAVRNIMQGFLSNPLRRERIQRKIERFPHFKQAFDEYHERLKTRHGFKVPE